MGVRLHLADNELWGTGSIVGFLMIYASGAVSFAVATLVLLDVIPLCGGFVVVCSVIAI